MEFLNDEADRSKRVRATSHTYTTQLSAHSYEDVKAITVQLKMGKEMDNGQPPSTRLRIRSVRLLLARV